jgi:hypothetical protein
MRMMYSKIAAFIAPASDDAALSASAEPSLRNVKIDWDNSPNQLLTGDLSALDPDDASMIKSAAERPDVIAFARRVGVGPTALVIAAIAQLHASTKRSAARIAKIVLGKLSPDERAEILEMLGLV